ncbi:hypothetical protein BV898_18709 [Hypsibius exemplaris]|uniref:Receptor ligand binding region domain-containing protein n=1 Tax=Hypsibius exemplaris TaxID=2072580 RepID=A0A9X6NK53_HYPEX|nr:hypothetical protein BV898_18709 [Hypsibius exemplaris]
MTNPKAVSSLLIYKRNVVCKDVLSYDVLLSEIRAVTRVVFFLGRQDYLRRFLIEASIHNMTNGEYVYICSEAYQLPTDTGNLSWAHRDPNDEITRAQQALGSVLMVHPYNPLFNASHKGYQLAERFQEKANCMLNLSRSTYDQPVRDALILASYSTVGFFAQVLNETLHSDGIELLRDGRAISSKFLQRLYQDGYSEIYMEESGIRHTRLMVSHFIKNTGIREGWHVSFPYSPTVHEENFTIDG